MNFHVTDLMKIQFQNILLRLILALDFLWYLQLLSRQGSRLNNHIRFLDNFQLRRICKNLNEITDNFFHLNLFSTQIELNLSRAQSISADRRTPVNTLTGARSSSHIIWIFIHGVVEKKIILSILTRFWYSCLPGN